MLDVLASILMNCFKCIKQSRFVSSCQENDEAKSEEWYWQAILASQLRLEETRRKDEKKPFSFLFASVNLPCSFYKTGSACVTLEVHCEIYLSRRKTKIC
jgi:hypothetical protein